MNKPIMVSINRFLIFLYDITFLSKRIPHRGMSERTKDDILMSQERMPPLLKF